MAEQTGPSVRSSLIAEGPIPAANRLKRLARGARKSPNVTFGATIVILMVLMALLAPFLFTSDPIETNTRDRFQSPSFSDHWFGSDNLGRDIYSRTVYGARVSMIVAASVAGIALTVGAILGLIAGYVRNTDLVIMRVVDGLMSIPSILLAIALMALLGGSVQNVIIALSVTETPIAVRVVRSAVLSVREEEYALAARVIGAPVSRIISRHIFPNIIAPLIVQGTFIASSAVLLEAYLSYLGAGTPPEVPSWGIIMADAQNYLRKAIWAVVYPGIFLTLTVLGISLAGDGLRDLLDPKLKRRM